MTLLILVAFLFLLSMIGYRMGRSRVVGMVRQGAGTFHSLPSYYGVYVALWSALPALALLSAWLAFEPSILEWIVVNGLPPDIQTLPHDQLGLFMNEVETLGNSGKFQFASSPAVLEAAQHYRSIAGTGFAAMAALVLAVAVIGGSLGMRYIRPALRARNRVEQVVTVFLVASSTVAIFTTIGIVVSLLFESLRFFHLVPITDFLFGTSWSPQMAMRSDQVGSSGAFGAVPLFTGTLIISIIAMLVAVPIGLLSAIYMAEYAHPKVRAVAKPLLEVLAGIPTVVYGVFAVLTVAPALRGLGSLVGVSIASESALTTGLVMGIMIIPLISSLSDDVITAVPDSLRQGAYGLGATQSETIRQVVVPAALPGIIGGVLLAFSRAIGETMIVVMAAGLSARMTANPLEAVTTVTVQIVTLLVGDQEFDSPKTLSAFALGLVLFVVTLVLNVVALGVVRKYREKYE